MNRQEQKLINWPALEEIEKVIKGMEQFKADFKPFCGNRADWERFDAGLAMLKEQEEQIKTRDESLEKAREEIKWLRGMLKEQEPVKVKDYADIVDGIQVGYCPKCDRKIVWNPEKEETVAFCKYCGKAVKWNEDQQISDC